MSKLLVVFAIAGILGGCSPSSPTPTPTPTPLPAVTEADVAEARSQLVTNGVTASELTEACGYYAGNGWAYTDAWNAANKAAADADHTPALRRIADVVTDVSIAAEDIATPTGWAVSLAESIDKPLAEWTEADHTRYEGAIVARKRQLVEPLCTQ